MNNCSCSPPNINVPLLENFNIADIVCAPPAKIPPHINPLAKPSTNDLNPFSKIVLKLSPLKIETISELITLIPPDINPAIAAALNPIPSAAKNEPPVNTVKTAPITIHIAPITSSFQCSLHHSPTFLQPSLNFSQRLFFTVGLHVVVLVVKIVFALNNSQSLYSCILLQLLIVSKSCETFSWFVGILSPP